ncbi:MAG: hypothetical protein H7232_17535 [Aeromicrobium sp.]|nr:hypothetical protein [Burkholderiales bacterium]
MGRLPLAKKIGLRLTIIVMMLVACEFAFRYGVWDKLAKPGSYAGTVVMIKNAVESLGPDKVDFLTIGDSIVGSGLNHQEVATTAQKYGLTHVHVGTGGMHWMSTDFMIRWVKQQSPRLQNAVIATNVNNFRFAGNGEYELAISAPIARPWNSERMLNSVEFKKENIRTYGVYSALFQYRDDIRDLVESPVKRVRDIRWTRRYAPNEKIIFDPIAVSRNICRVPLASIQACADTKSPNPEDINVVTQCRNDAPRAAKQAEQKLDYRTWVDPTSWPHLNRLKPLRQQQLRDLPLKRPIMVVLMPVPKLTRESIQPIGIHEWTLSVLNPLVEEGTIELHDYTKLFDDGGESGGAGGPNGGIDCTAFHDLSHLNSVGQSRLTAKLLPILEDHLYRRAASGGNATK